MPLNQCHWHGSTPRSLTHDGYANRFCRAGCAIRLPLQLHPCACLYYTGIMSLLQRHAVSVRCNRMLCTIAIQQKQHQHQPKQRCAQLHAPSASLGTETFAKQAENVVGSNNAQQNTSCSSINKSSTRLLRHPPAATPSRTNHILQ